MSNGADHNRAMGDGMNHGSDVYGPIPSINPDTAGTGKTEFEGHTVVKTVTPDEMGVSVPRYSGND